MDAASLAIGIVALYSTCRDCYDFFTTVQHADDESAVHLRELMIQQSILKAWGFHWQLHTEKGTQTTSSGIKAQGETKLHKYLSSNQFKAEGVFSTLSALADTLSNQDKLVKRYGVQLRLVNASSDEMHLTNNVQLAILDAAVSDVQPVVAEVKSRLSILNKFKWALKDKLQFKSLISELRLHSDALYRLCPENAFDSMNIYLMMECLAGQESPTGLQRTSAIAKEQAEIDSRSLVRNGYKLLASAATLKASVNENREGGKAKETALLPIDEEEQDTRYLGKSLALFKDEVVYIEMRDYRGPPLDPTPEQEKLIKLRQRRAKQRKSSRKMARDYKIYWEDLSYSSTDDDAETGDDEDPIELVRPSDPKLRALIGNFYNTFKGAQMRETVAGLDMIGLIDHAEGQHKGHCSLLYRLPGTIGLQGRERPAENLKLRAPSTLQSLLGVRMAGIDSTLGARFELARKLVRAVCLLHSSGWLHRNIRAESVIFFPDHANTTKNDKYETGTDIDVSKPTLMGYIFSRPDDIIVRIDMASASKPEGNPLRPAPPGVSETVHVWNGPGEAKRRLDRHSRAPRASSIYGRDMLNRNALPDVAKDINISGFTLDYYQHPAKHANPTRLYRHAYDVYSLGILLLEIGLWQQIGDYQKSSKHDDEDQYERRRWICRKYIDDLRWACGDTYANVVLSCLMIDSSDDNMAQASERELCVKLVADLENCQA